MRHDKNLERRTRSKQIGKRSRGGARPRRSRAAIGVLPANVSPFEERLPEDPCHRVGEGGVWRCGSTSLPVADPAEGDRERDHEALPARAKRSGGGEAGNSAARSGTAVRRWPGHAPPDPGSRNAGSGWPSSGASAFPTGTPGSQPRKADAGRTALILVRSLERVAGRFPRLAKSPVVPVHGEPAGWAVFPSATTLDDEDWTA